MQGEEYAPSGAVSGPSFDTAASVGSGDGSRVGRVPSAHWGCGVSVQRLPSGRWRAQVWDPELDVKHSVTTLLTPNELRNLGADPKGTFGTREDAISARAFGRRKLEERRDNVTIADFREVWLTSPVFSGHWADSTRVHRRERTEARRRVRRAAHEGL